MTNWQNQKLIFFLTFAPAKLYFMSPLNAISIKDFITRLEILGIRRTYFATVQGNLICPHDEIKELAAYVASSPDYNQHEGIFLEIDPENQCVYGAFIHQTYRGAGQGGTRLKQYPNIASVLTDGLRLAEGMTYKNACADIWWGGGKGVIWCHKKPREIHGEEREQVFSNYGRFVASLKGCYVTAEDMNTTPEDMRVIHANNRFCTCVPVEIGGSSNPSEFTARGVFQGMTAAVEQAFGKGVGLKGKHVLLQGAGNVGYPLMEEVVRNGGRVTVFDLNEDLLAKINNRFVPAQVTIERDYQTFLITEADIFSPNAIGGILNSETIPDLKVKVVAGGANNQLRDPEVHARMLMDQGIVYAPDFIINCMGIINCANEQYGYLLSDIESEIRKVYDRTKYILERSAEENLSTAEIAEKIAEEKSVVPHPIWGHRSLEIIEELIRLSWEKSN